jgi:hypothetical protein
MTPEAAAAGARTRRWPVCFGGTGPSCQRLTYNYLRVAVEDGKDLVLARIGEVSARLEADAGPQPDTSWTSANRWRVKLTDRNAHAESPASARRSTARSP